MLPGCRSGVRPSVRLLSVNTYFAWGDISVLSGGISIDLATNIHHLSGYCCNDFQGQRSKMKVIAKPKVYLSKSTFPIHRPLSVWRRHIPVDSVASRMTCFRNTRVWQTGPSNGFCIQQYHFSFYRDAAMQARYSYEHLSVRLSVRLSNACIVTKRKHLAKTIQLRLIGSRLRAFQWV